MLERKDWRMSMTQKTRTITPHSGQNSDESRSRIETLLGELSVLNQDDPYWAACVSLWALLSRKRNYYNCKKDALSNARGVSETGIIPWRYQLARIGEKYRRLGGQLKTIDIRGTMMDIAGHAIIAFLLCSEGESDGDSSEDS